jgi:hypothetical protein
MFICNHHRGRKLAGIVAGLAMSAPILSCAGTSDVPVANEKVWSPSTLSRESGDLPEARAVIRRAIDFMRSHPRVAFEALSTYEVVQENGQKLQFDMLQRVALEQPGRLFWVTLYDDASRDSAWCDTGTFTFLREPANIWARVETPPTVAAAVSKIAKDYNIVIPFVDLLSGDLDDLWLGDAVESVHFIGETWAEGQWTDHVAVRKAGIDTQIWFRQGAEPFPVKIAIVRTALDGQPGFWALFRRWSTDLPDGSIPTFEPPENSERVEIVPGGKR